MKLRIATLLILMASLLMARELAPVDETKAIYQLDWGVMPPFDMWFGGSWSERQLTRAMSPAERAAIEATATAAMYRKAAFGSWVLAGLACVGSYLMKAREGIGIAIICALFSFASSFMATTVHYGLRIAVCAVIALGVAMCYHPKVRDWSASSLPIFKRKKDA